MVRIFLTHLNAHYFRSVVIAESYLSVIRDNPRIPIVSMMGRSISPQHLDSASPASDRQKPLSPAPRLAYFVKE